jgi:uncharacterized protein (TIGR02452 family)
LENRWGWFIAHRISPQSCLSQPVFGNDPALLARLFSGALSPPGRFAGKFEHVAFAVLDSRGDTLAPFAELFR